MKYTVFGTAQVTVSTVVEFDDAESPTEDEIFERATMQFSGIHSYCGNGGVDKLIGVESSKDSIAANEYPTFDDFQEE